MANPNDLPTASEAYAGCRKLLGDYTALFEQPVAWGEMDAFGHINNIVYFRYFESARMEYFRRIRYAEEIDVSGIGPILAETKCRFRAALTYPDFIVTGARVTDIQDDRFGMQYAVASYRLGRIAAEGSGLIVSYNYQTNQKIALPDEIVRRIRELESRNED
ncbi:MAG: acyl-CoA thioesterase [Gammaproteobacteria bacterium]|nr:acyl-CoA thioesterase [Gammaproteobacteria bacterium]